jgi:hypothetical protein
MRVVAAVDANRPDNVETNEEPKLGLGFTLSLACIGIGIFISIIRVYPDSWSGSALPSILISI